MRGVIALLLVACVAAACGATRSTLKGADGISYDWPPPASVVSGPPSTARFCALLVDDEEHVKAIQSSQGLAAAVSAYRSLFPGLQAAAPAPLASNVRTYLAEVSDIFGLLAQHGYNYFAVPLAQLKAVEAQGSQAASNAVTTFASQQCHYEINGGP